MRERLFAIGAGLMIALAIGLPVLLWSAGTDGGNVPPITVAGACLLIGALFALAAREAREHRRAYRRAAEDGGPFPPGGPPK